MLKRIKLDYLYPSIIYVSRKIEKQKKNITIISRAKRNSAYEFMILLPVDWINAQVLVLISRIFYANRVWIKLYLNLTMQNRQHLQHIVRAFTIFIFWISLRTLCERIIHKSYLRFYSRCEQKQQHKYCCICTGVCTALTR